MENNNTAAAPNAEKKYTIELKNVKTFRGNEGYGLNCDVYVNGIKCFFLMDDASGSILYQHEVYNKALYKELEEYAKSLPDEIITCFDEPYRAKINIDSLCDKAFELYQQEQEFKKIEKKMVNKIMWGVKGAASYYEVILSKNIADIPHDELVRLTIKYTAKLKKGEVLFNTNLPEI